MDQRRFEELWERCVGAGGEDAFRRLEALYGEPHRHYHDQTHIVHCLRQFDLAHALTPDPDAVEMALWFHDAIYEVPDGPSPDNERRSAELFLITAAGRGSAQFRSDVYRLIMITAHRKTPVILDECYIVDIDLSGFGIDWPGFMRDNRNVRAEQPDRPESEYYAKEEAFLRSLLDRPTVFRTEFFRERHERRARENIERYLGIKKPLKPGVGGL